MGGSILKKPVHRGPRGRYVCAGSEGAACWFGDMVVEISIWKERSEAVCGTNLKERLEKSSSEIKLDTKGVGRVTAWGRRGAFLEELKV